MRSGELVQLPAKQANFPPNRLPASNYLPVPAPPLSAPPGKVGARARRDGKWVRGGALGLLKKRDIADVLALGSPPARGIPRNEDGRQGSATPREAAADATLPGLRGSSDDRMSIKD